MNATLLSLAALSSAGPPDGANPSTGAVSLQTALLVILVAVLILVIRSLAGLRTRIEDLEHTQKNLAGGTAASTGAGSATSLVTTGSLTPGGVETVPDEIAAVIAASVYATFGTRARIAAVTPAHSDDRTWSLEGRRHIFHSHKVR